jgi:hypothetical protein
MQQFRQDWRSLVLRPSKLRCPRLPHFARLILRVRGRPVSRDLGTGPAKDKPGAGVGAQEPGRHLDPRAFRQSSAVGRSTSISLSAPIVWRT